MHGIGNDFVLVDVRSVPYSGARADLARAICDRRLGVGADGLIFVEKGDVAPVRMRMLNPDGSESEMCGNGLRCVAAYIGEASEIETGGTSVRVQFLADGRVRVDMGEVRVTDLDFEAGEYRGVKVDAGNPHFVVFVGDVGGIDLERVGPRLEQDPAFPARTNVHFAEVGSPSSIVQRTWERGAGITLACGSGACATAVAALAKSLTTPKVEVRLPGGTLDIEIETGGRVWMTGTATHVFRGEFRL